MEGATIIFFAVAAILLYRISDQLAEILKETKANTNVLRLFAEKMTGISDD